MRYNPFNKDISRLNKDDLAVLRDVAEGWYVEYKETFVSAKNISKSISAFANSDGGWLFLGVAAGKVGNFAENINGFELSDVNCPKDKLRDIIKNNISPIPMFDSKLIELGNGRVVLVVCVNRGDEAPYLTKEGRIYRRINEGSDPIPETDRYSIERLFERSQGVKDRIEEFSINPFSMSKHQKEQKQCFLEVYLYVTPLNSFEFPQFSGMEFFERLYNKFTGTVSLIMKEMKMGIPFRNFTSAAGSYIMRYFSERGMSIDFGLTIEIFRNGCVRFFIPIPQIDLNFSNVPFEYKDSQNLKNFLEIVSRDELKFLKIIDGYKTILIVAILFEKYWTLLRDVGCKQEIGARFRFDNSWRTLAYIDDEHYVGYIKKYGLPVCLKAEIEAPEFVNGNLIKIREIFDFKEDYFDSINIAKTMIELMGFPVGLFMETMLGMTQYINKIMIQNENINNVIQ